MEYLNISSSILTAQINCTNHTVSLPPENLIKVLSADRDYLQHLRFLELSQNKISNLPDDIYNLQQLEYLSLSQNNLFRIPAGICNLKNLKFLNLSENNLSYLPDDICNLRNLIYLNTSRNCLFSLPENLSHLHRLEFLNASHNHLKNLPNSFASLKELLSLNLSNNYFVHLPDFVYCTALKELIFSYNKNVSQASLENICHLSNLEVLSLKSNNLTKLPEKLSFLTKLKVLELDDNHFESIPSSILSSCTELMRIDPSSYKITENQDSFKSCKKLKFLNLRRNSITFLPPIDIGSANLVYLDVSSNKITQILPWVSDLTKLRYLSIRGNEVENLNENFKEVAKVLRVLDISRNKFKQVPLCVLPEGSKITYLHLDNNPISNIPSEISNLPFLTHLSVSNCSLHSLPNEIGRLSKLKVLILSSNNLAELPSSMKELGNLNYLDLSNNEFRHFPIVVCYITYLKVLLYNNCNPLRNSRDYIKPSECGHSISSREVIDLEGMWTDNNIPELKFEEAFKREKERSKSTYCIPKIITYLEFLVHLSLDGNALDFLPNIFHKCKRLERIYANDNNLDKIPCSLALCNTLTHIELRNNKLKVVNAPVYKLPKLERLDLSGNRFLRSFNEMTNNLRGKGLIEYLQIKEKKSRKFSLNLKYSHRFISIPS